MRGKGSDYFENSRRATLSQRAYGADNPNQWIGYSADIWGWSASDGPGYSKDKYRVNGTLRSFNGYMARGGSRSEEHTSELQSLKRNSNAVFRMKKKNTRSIE